MMSSANRKNKQSRKSIYKMVWGTESQGQRFTAGRREGRRASWPLGCGEGRLDPEGRKEIYIGVRYILQVQCPGRFVQISKGSIITSLCGEGNSMSLYEKKFLLDE